MNDYLTFKKMITPILIQVLFWVGVVGCILSGLFAMFSGQFLYGLLIILVGPIFVRLYCELIIVIFSINDSLTQIKNK